MAPRISLRPQALAALADELAALAGSLADEGERCRAAARPVDAALGGREGAAVGVVAGTWGTLASTLAEGTAAVAGTLRGAVAAYGSADEELAARIGAAERPQGPGPC